MSDKRLREAERRWLQTGDFEDYARLLVECVRAGDLRRDRLELASYCGHEPSLCAIGRAELLRQDAAEHDWVIGLVDYGREASFRAGIAIARQVVAAWRRHLPNLLAVPEPDPALAALNDMLEPVVARAERYLLGDQEALEPLTALTAQGEALLAAWRVANDQLPDAVDLVRRTIWETSKDERMGLVQAARTVAELHRLAVADESQPGLVGVGRLTRPDASEPAVDCGALSTCLTRLSVGLDYQFGALSYMNAVKAELIPWALGLGDPVRIRVFGPGRTENGSPACE